MTDSTRFAWRRLVVRDPHLTDATRRVLLELESYADPDGSNAHPGVERIAAQLLTAGSKTGHVSDRTVRTALATGVDRGLIELTAKAPRRRGNKRSDVYRLTFPDAVTPATQTAALTEADRPATQTAALSASYTGNPSELDRQSGAVRPATAIADHQILYTRPLTPEHSSHLSNAREEPTPLSRIDQQIPGGFRIGERARAEELLGEGISESAVIYKHLLPARHTRPARSRPPIAQEATR